MPRSVYCEYEKRQTEGLDRIPWPGEAGKRVYDHIGKTAWSAWLAHQTMLINENRLSPLNPEHRAMLEREMLKFLFDGGSAGGKAEKPPGYIPPSSSDPSSAG